MKPRRPLDLVLTPTPLMPLAVEGLSAPLWVKDEARAGALMGGNKVRKLRWILADAHQMGRTELVTVGGVGSHHVLATALYGTAQGLRTHAVIFGQPASAHVAEIGGRIAAACASVTPLEDVLRGAAATAALYARIAAGGRPYRVAVGGSSVVGTLGWIEGGLELAAQLGAMNARPERIYAAAGTSGTVAGLLAGVALAGLQVEVVGVRVVGRSVANRPRIRRLARRALQQWGTEVPLGPVRLIHDWFEGGYGVTSDRVHEARDVGQRHGLPLEATYTAKAFGACLAEARKDRVEAVFVQTASAPLSSEPGSLPATLQHLLS